MDKIKTLTAKKNFCRQNECAVKTQLSFPNVTHIHTRMTTERLVRTNKSIYMKKQKKKPRISFKILQDEKKRRGLILPNIKLYYQAESLVWTVDSLKTQDKGL